MSVGSGLHLDVTFSLSMIASWGLPLQFSHSHKKIPPKQKAYGTDPRAAKAAKFHVDCERNGMHISIPSAMRAKGYDDDAAQRTIPCSSKSAGWRRI